MPEVRHILLVDDNLDEGAVIRQFLGCVEDCDYRITQVETAEALMALCQAEYRHFDLLMLDYLLPDSDGLSILRELRSPENRCRDLPIILLTGYGSEAVAVQAIKGGAQDYIPKSSYSTERLHVAISNAIESVRTQTSLRQTEVRYRALISATAHIVWSASPEGKTTYSSHAWELLTGQTKVDQSDFGWLDAVHPDDRQHVEQAWRQALAQQVPYLSEFRVRARDGSYRDMEARGVPLRDKNGSVIEWIGMNIDITDRKEAERALAAANERFWLAAEAVEAIIFDLDLLRNHVTRTVGVTKMLGYRLNEVEPTREWWQGRIYPEDYDASRAIVDEALRSADSYSVQHRMIRKDGKVIHVWERGLIVRDNAGKPVRVVGSTIDISEIKEAQARLAEQQAFISYVADNIAALVYVYDLVERRNIYVNQYIEEISGLTPDAVQAMGDRWLPSFIHPDDLPVAATALAQMLSANDDNPVEVEYRARHRDGTWHWLMGRDRVIKRDADGKPLQIIGVAHDVTQHKEAEAQRADLLRLEQAARARAEEASRAKLQFLGMVSHDLRTPLAAIKGFTTTLLAKDATFNPRQQEKFLQIIDQETDRLSALIDDLLEISQMQSGTLSVERAPVRLEDILASIQPQLQTLTNEHCLVTALPPELPAVHADARRIGQVLVNLVSNAAKFSPVGSDIEIRARAGADAVLVEVCDQGSGIPPDKREDVFNAFTQLQTQQRSKGAGLGLAICKSLVEMHGGSIWVEDGEGRGARVCFTLPLV